VDSAGGLVDRPSRHELDAVICAAHTRCARPSPHPALVVADLPPAALQTAGSISTRVIACCRGAKMTRRTAGFADGAGGAGRSRWMPDEPVAVSNVVNDCSCCEIREGDQGRDHGGTDRCTRGDSYALAWTCAAARLSGARAPSPPRRLSPRPASLPSVMNGIFSLPQRQIYVSPVPCCLAQTVAAG
jgi:hypothetical protein